MGLVVSCILLSILYYIVANYYQCSRITTHFSLTYLTSTDMILQSLILICVVIIQTMLVAAVYVLSKHMNKDFENQLQLNFDSDHDNKNKTQQESHPQTVPLRVRG